MNASLRKTIRCALVMLVSPVFFGLLLAHPLAASFRTFSGTHLHAWQSQFIYRAFPLLFLFLLVATTFIWRWCGRQLRHLSGRTSRLFLALRPLLWLPAVACGGYLAPWIGITISGWFLPYGTAAIAAWTLENLLGDSVSSSDSTYRPRIFSWSILMYGIFIFATGFYFANKIGSKSGDEVHYLVQLESLVQDGDIELSNEMAPVIQEHGRQCLSYSHIVENDQGKLYSYHAFGLPLLAWPFGYLGVFGRQLILAIIAALAITGCRAACLAAKAPPRAASVVTWFLAYSYIWAMYSTRFLPEILGCGLIAWGCWALAAQEETRWRATLVAAVCCGFLPYAHVRWAPPSLIIAVFFGFEGLFMKNETIGAKLLRLFAFAAIYAAFGFLLLYIHSLIYSGSQAYNYENIFFAYPRVMWAMFADRRGLLGLLPALIWYSISIPFCLALGKRAALRASESAAVFASVLLSACTTTAALGGACIPGRYLLSAIPALLPPAAILLSRAPKAAKTWFYFLASMPVLFYVFIGTSITKSSIPFIRVPEKIRSYVGFHAYWEPLPAFLQTVNPDSIFFVTLFLLLLALFTILLLGTRKAPRLAGFFVFLVFVAAVSCGFMSDKLENAHKDTNLFLLSKDRNWRHFVTDSKTPSPELFSTLLGKHPEQSPISTLSERKRTPQDPYSFMSLQDIPYNDWDDRNIRWHVIRPSQIRHNFNGCVAFRVVGKVKRGRARFAVRQGAFTLEENHIRDEGTFDFTWIIRTRKGRGFTNTMMTLLDEVGEIQIDYFQLAPYSPDLLSAGFTFPSSTEIRDLTDR